MNHPLDCPICDQAGECKLQDYSYQYGSGDSRMVEPKRRYRYEDLGARIVLDKNRCIHCTRCVRFTQEISGTTELTMANRGAELEVTTYAGKSMDTNPLAGNVVDLCPVGALTSRDFRFTKRVWYLKPIPTISRHGAMASPIWADVDATGSGASGPGPGGACDLLPLRRGTVQLSPLQSGPGQPACRTRCSTGIPPRLRPSAEAMRHHAPVAVVGQGTFGCDTAQRLGALANDEKLKFGSGDKLYQIQYPKLANER